MPLLVLLLPRRVETIAIAAGIEAAFLLSWVLLAGGLIAGFAHILAGAIGDRWIKRFGDRRGLISIGAVLIALAYLGLAFASGIPSLFSAIILFQLALNCAFAPLGALLADHFPHTVKGRLGGIANAALPASSLTVAAVAWLFPTDGVAAFLLVGAVSVVCMIPLLLLWPLGPPIGSEELGIQVSGKPTKRLFADFAIAWAARLMIQIGAAFVIGYLYIYVAATRSGNASWQAVSASEVIAIITAPAALVAVFAAIASGHFSDRHASRRTPLFGAALIFAFGVGILASTPSPLLFVIGYGLFQIGLTAFLSVDTALVAQLVSGHSSRGTLLGLMNLSNTLPAVIAPALVLMAVGETDIAPTLQTLFAICAIAALASGALMMLIKNVR